jgi:hypothetical protein
MNDSRHREELNNVISCMMLAMRSLIVRLLLYFPSIIRLSESLKNVKSTDRRRDDDELASSLVKTGGAPAGFAAVAPSCEISTLDVALTTGGRTMQAPLLFGFRSPVELLLIPDAIGVTRTHSPTSSGPPSDETALAQRETR